MNSLRQPDEADSGEFYTTVEKKIEIEDATFRYLVAGTKRPGQSTLMLVHGAGGSTQAHYGYLMPMFARHRRVASIDMSPPRGVGGDGLTIDHLGRQVIAAIEDETAGAPVALLGYSLGAVIAAYVAGTRPDLVDRLVLVNGWMKTDQQQMLRNVIWRTLRAEGSAALKDFMVFCALSGDFMNFLLPAELGGAASAFRVDEFVDQQMDLTRRIDITSEALAIAAPTLVVGSRDDQMAPPRHSRALFGAIDDARYYEVTAGHAALHERTAEILRIAEDFLAAPGRYSAGTVVESLRP